MLAYAHISLSNCSTGQTSVLIRRITTLLKPVFLLNSRCSFFFCPHHFWCALFSRSYERFLPSSFKKIRSYAFIYSMCSPAAVSSTVKKWKGFFQTFLFNAKSIQYDFERIQMCRLFMVLLFATLCKAKIIVFWTMYKEHFSSSHESFPFGRNLRDRLLLQSGTLCRTPWTLGDCDFDTNSRYSYQHSHLLFTKVTFQHFFLFKERSATI